MKKLIIAGAATAAALGAVPATAAPIFYFNTSYQYPYATSANVYESFESAPAGAYVANTGQAGVTGETVTGNVTVATGTVPGVTADPDPNNTGGAKYLTVTNGSYTTNLASVYGAGGVQFFSFLLGSLDTYNTLSLTFGSGATAVTTAFTGTELAALIATSGGPATTFNASGNSGTAGRFSVSANGGAGLTSATFSSTQAAFEIDALAAAVPEPATWGMMILGVGLMGAQLRVRRRKVTFAAA